VPSTFHPQLSTPPPPAAAPAVLGPWSLVFGPQSLVLPLSAFAILWADLIRQLSYMWSTSEQYAYGWFVPVFAVGLFLKKWPGRPLTIERGLGTKDQGPGTMDQGSVVGGLVVLCAASLLPLRIVHEVNQDWALFSWLMTLVVVGLTLYAVFLLGGWPWVRYFAFPICFIFVAVRWPYRIENSLTYRLMGVVASLTVELLGWLGVPAAQHGNLIEVATGTVGVDEACSGIRSFQSSLMAGLLMGELYLLRAWARAGLVGLALLLAFGFNVVRTLILTWQANAHGVSAVDRWHDSAGMTITIACFFCLWAVAVLITKCWGERGESRKQKAEIAPADEPQVSGLSLHPSGSFQLSGFSSQPCRRFMLAVGCWALVSIAATEAWYRSHETNRVITAQWWANFPTNLPSAREIPLSKLARSKLKYDQGSTLAWEEPDGSKWSAFCFRWDAGVATSRMSARDHRPEYCLGGSGYNCQADFGIRYLPAHGLELPFRTYIFDRSGVVLYVFHCIWEDGAAKQKGFGTSKYLDRLETVLAGKRRLGQQTLEIIVSGYPGTAEAEQAVRQRLPSLVQLGAAPDKLNSLDRQGEQ
jgi:exosortase